MRLKKKLKKKVYDSIELLKENPYRDEKLVSAKLKGHWSFHVEKNFMLIHTVERDLVTIKAMGDHDAAYDDFERYLRKFGQ